MSASSAKKPGEGAACHAPPPDEGKGGIKKKKAQVGRAGTAWPSGMTGGQSAAGSPG